MLSRSRKVAAAVLPVALSCAVFAAPAAASPAPPGKPSPLTVSFKSKGADDIAVVRDASRRAGVKVRLRLHTSKGVRVVAAARTNGRGVARFVLPERLTTEMGRLMSVSSGGGRVTHFWSVDGAPQLVGAVPAAPGNFVVEPGNEKVFLSWSPVVNATRYRSVVKVAGQETFGPWVETTSTSIAGLVNGNRITVGVQAANDEGEGAIAYQDGVKPNAQVPGDIPSLTVTPGDGEALLTWYPAARGDDYVVLYRAVGSSKMRQHRVSIVGGLDAVPFTSTVDGLTNGVPYEFTVYPENVYGRGNDISRDATPDFDHVVVEYHNTTFVTGEDHQVLSPTTRGAKGTVTYSVTGTLPEDVTFDQATGVFTGPGASDWDFTPVDISAGASHACAVTDAGLVKCWGDNAFGQLGDATRYNRALPVDVVGLPAAAVSVTAGDTHTCATLVDGSVSCWGDNADGALGNGTFYNSTVAVAVKGLSNVSAVSAGGHHTCAVSSDGSVSCWGDNADGALGDGSYSNSNTPVLVSDMSEAVNVAAGTNHTCATDVDGSLSCWGDNKHGQLGTGNYVSSNVAVPVVSLPGAVTALAAGADRSCVVANGSAYCFGSGKGGAIGNGGYSDVTKPTAVANIGGVVTGVTTNGDHSCAATLSGDTYCWGGNAYGQIGDGSTIDRSKAVKVSGLSGKTVTTGTSFSCAITTDGDADCWGRNNFGQIGDGTALNRTVPTQVFRLNSLGFPATVTVTATDASGSTNSVTITLKEV